MERKGVSWVEVLAPAKLNLALDITGVQADGYHTVDMVMQAIDVYERVKIRKAVGYSLRCPGSPVPTDERNTATKAARAFFTGTGLLAGCGITVHKTVPTRAGMAGGSADAAAVLVGLNELYGARLTLDELCAMGKEVGADVPFAILGGTARVGGIGEILTPLPALTAGWFAVAMPHGGGVSTPAAYAAYDELQSPAHPDVGAVQSAVQAQDLQALALAMGNGLEAASGDEDTVALKNAFMDAGALAAMMTGSGAAVFGLYADEAAAKAGANAARALARQVFVARPVGTGPVVRQGI